MSRLCCTSHRLSVYDVTQSDPSFISTMVTSCSSNTFSFSVSSGLTSHQMWFLYDSACICDYYTCASGYLHRRKFGMRISRRLSPSLGLALL